MPDRKISVSLVGLNPGGAHSTNLYLLQSFAYQNLEVKKHVDIKIHFFDLLIPAQSNGLDVIMRTILDDQSDIYGFSCYCWNIIQVLELTKVMKSIYADKQIFLGGPEVSAHCKTLLHDNDQIDFILKGEGELAFLKMMEYCIGLEKQISRVNNLVYRKNGEIVENEELQLECLEQIPPLFSSGLIDMDLLGESLYSFETKRGCQYRCDYCFHHKGSHVIREYPLEYVKKELDVLLHSKLKYIWFTDPCFNENQERSIKIIKYIVENNIYNIEFGFELRNETLSEEFIQELSKIKSIRFVAMGLQTLTKEALEIVHRDFQKQIFERNMQLIRKYFSKNVRIHVDLIYGLPGDTLEGYMRSVDYVIAMDGIIFTQPLKVLPGTTLEENIDQYHMHVNPYPPYEVLYHDTFSFEDMNEVKKINLGIYLFQADDRICQSFKKIAKIKDKPYSMIFQEVGNYFWDQKMYDLFRNYLQFSFRYLAGIVRDCFQALYQIEVDFSDEDGQDRVIQLDWGSVAKQEFSK